MLQFFHTIDTEIFNAQYEVTIAGKHVDCMKARVSAMPYNTIWPGCQRPVEQTELISMVSFAGDEDVVVSVKSNKIQIDETTDIKIRPLSKQVNYEVDDNRIVFVLKENGAYTVELNGFHEVLTIFYNPVKDFLIEAEKDVNENRKLLYYPEGIHHIGTVELESHTTVVVDSGAVLYGAFTAICAEDIKICGYGIIDGSLEDRKTEEGFILHDFDQLLPYEKDELKSYYNRNEILNGCIRFYRCKNISVESIILRDSTFWSFMAAGCDNLQIDNVKTIGMWKYNADGIDVVNCSRVTIRNCFLRNFDDCIVIKGIAGWEDRNNENILVENCVVWCDWGRSLEYGAETNAPEYRNIVMRNCDLIHNSTVLMDIQHNNEAEIHHCLFENINAEYSKYQLPDIYQEDMEKPYTGVPNTEQPLLMGIFVYDEIAHSKKNLHGCVHDIIFRNINVYKDEEVSMPESKFMGFEGHRVSNVVIDGLYVNGKKVDSMEEANIFVNEFTDNINLL